MKKNINEAEWKVRVDLAAMFRLAHMMGWDDTVWNHITARTPGTDHTFFMHQFGLVYEEVKASNLIKVDENGKVLEGPPDVNNQMEIARTEIFGPVLSIIPFENEEEAVSIANDTPYGLTNYIQTQDKEKVKRVARKLRSGMVDVCLLYTSPSPRD